jgi:hypothetical protein
MDPGLVMIINDPGFARGIVLNMGAAKAFALQRSECREGRNRDRRVAAAKIPVLPVAG